MKQNVKQPIAVDNIREYNMHEIGPKCRQTIDKWQNCEVNSNKVKKYLLKVFLYSV